MGVGIEGRSGHLRWGGNGPTPFLPPEAVFPVLVVPAQLPSRFLHPDTSPSAILVLALRKEKHPCLLKDLEYSPQEVLGGQDALIQRMSWVL